MQSDRRQAIAGPGVGAHESLTAGITRLEAVALGFVILVAAALRLPGLAARGGWDSDQGGQMLVLRAFVQDGVVPLVGPPASVGGFHHGALYYWLLAPAAALGGGDPTAVVAVIAVVGIVGAGLAWWLARGLGGPIAGIVAALLTATSATAVAASTSLWNPNLVPAAATLAAAGAWQAWSSRDARWWVATAMGFAIAAQCHVLSVLLLLPLGALFVADAWRRRGPSGGMVRLVRWGAVAAAVVAVSWVPHLVHEIGAGFTESRGVLAFLGRGGDPSPLDPVSRLVVVALRGVAWPLTGLITAAPVPGVLAVTGCVVGLAWRALAVGAPDRAGARWLGGSIAGCLFALGLGVSSLAVVTPLPVDQYHAFLDPLVIAGAAVAAAGLIRGGGIRRATGVLAVLAVVAWNLATLPPMPAPDGGWPAARVAAARVDETAGTRSLALVGMPSFKPTDAYGYPLLLRGRTLADPLAADVVAVLCDRLFLTACDVVPSDPVVAALGTFRVAERFEAAPGRTITIFVRAGR